MQKYSLPETKNSVLDINSIYVKFTIKERMDYLSFKTTLG